MSILDDAREIARYGPGQTDDDPCMYCRFIPHQEECVWLAMPRIVAALEAADRATTFYSDELAMRHARECDLLWHRDRACTCGLSQLVAAMMDQG